MLVYFEGVDGVGKSTQIGLCKESFPGALTTKEPGGTALGDKIREILLGSADKISSKSENLLFLADRAEHYEKFIKPNRDKLILSDRGFVSGIAYAMANDENLDIEELLNLNGFALGGDFGDKFIFFKATKELLHARLFSRGTSDEIEARGVEYLMRVQGFMGIILANLKFEVLELDASEPADALQEKIRKFI